MCRKCLFWLKKHWGFAIASIILIGILFLYFLYYQAKAKAAILSSPTVVFAQKDLLSSLTLSGIVDAKRKVTLFYPAGGKLTKVNVQQGDFVAAGQTLAVIDQADLQKRLEKSLNNYFSDRLQFDDYQEQFKTRSPTDNEVLTSQLDQISLNNSVLDVEIGSIAINNTRLISPIDGIITQAPTLVAPMNILYTDTFTVVDPDTLIFRALIDELDLNLIHEGQSALVNFDALPNLEINTVVDEISLTSIVGSSGTAFEVEFLLPGVDLDTVRLGMNGDARIILQEKKSVGSLPLEAIFIQDGAPYVRVLDQQTAVISERPVTTGLETENDIEILTGLELGELVVLN